MCNLPATNNPIPEHVKRMLVQHYRVSPALKALLDTFTPEQRAAITMDDDDPRVPLSERGFGE